MTDRPGETGGDPTYPGQQPPPSYPVQQPDYPGQQPGYPGQQPGYPGQQSGYPGQQSGYPGQQSGYPNQQPPPYGGGYGSAPSYPGGGYDGAAPASGWSGWAIAALISSLVPLLGILAAIPLAIVALVKIRRSRQRGQLLAIAAIIISILWWVGAIGLGVAWFNDTAERDNQGVITSEGRLEIGQIQIGDCVSIPSLEDPDVEVGVYEMRGVPCDEEHNAEAVGVVEIEGEEFPGSAALDEESRTKCVAQALDYLVNGLPEGVKGFRLIPTEDVWNDDGGHRSICFAVNSDYSDMEGSVIEK